MNTHPMAHLENIFGRSKIAHGIPPYLPEVDINRLLDTLVNTTGVPRDEVLKVFVEYGHFIKYAPYTGIYLYTPGEPYGGRILLNPGYRGSETATVAHELGHAYGLHHTSMYRPDPSRDPQEARWMYTGDSIMTTHPYHGTFTLIDNIAGVLVGDIDDIAPQLWGVEPPANASTVARLIRERTGVPLYYTPDANGTLHLYAPYYRAVVEYTINVTPNVTITPPPTRLPPWAQPHELAKLYQATARYNITVKLTPLDHRPLATIPCNQTPTPWLNHPTNTTNNTLNKAQPKP